MEQTDIKTLLTELELATFEHKEATDREAEASRAVTRATNRLNGAQKQMDRYMQSLRKDAPWNTEWSSRKGQAVEAGQ